MLSTYLINKYVAAMVPKTEKKDEYVHYGVYSDGKVLFDGADTATICDPLVQVSDGDRVVITIRDNSAYITGVVQSSSSNNAEEGA